MRSYQKYFKIPRNEQADLFLIWASLYGGMSNKRDILFTNVINTYGLSRQNNSKIQQ